MNLADIIALAKQGYKSQDIKDLIALAGSEDAGAGSEDAGGGAGSDDAGGEDAGGGAGSEDAGGGAGSDDAGGGAGSEDADGGTGSKDAGKSEMEQLVDQLRQQNKNLQDALKRMDLSKNVKTESASGILKETLTSLF